MPRDRLTPALLIALTTFSGLLPLASAQAGRTPYWAYAPQAHYNGRLTRYAGDCGPYPPPGYRYDLRNWRLGDNDRDFSCFMLDEPN